METYVCLIGGFIVFVVIFMAVFAPFISPHDPITSVADPLMPPNSEFPLGTDNLGRDVLSRIIYGSRTVLLVALVSSLFSLVIGVSLGLLSGYAGGSLDRALSLIMDSIYAFPGLILAIAIAAMLGPGISNMTVAIAIVYIPTYFRMTRGQVLSLKGHLFVEAARAIGADDKTIMFRYILPNLLSTVVVVFTLNIADAILTEAGLSFLGLGVPPPTPDWGFDLKSGQGFFTAGYWWLITFPGIMIILLVIGFSLLGEGLNEILNPRLRAR
ncbi:ABC transporter permease [Candidatus Geothermarchaeota archaeon]|nr:MAG: ABC transporter permease [Candidatus Geothermarchaeota archaeon]